MRSINVCLELSLHDVQLGVRFNRGAVDVLAEETFLSLSPPPPPMLFITCMLLRPTYALLIQCMTYIICCNTHKRQYAILLFIRTIQTLHC